MLHQQRTRIDDYRRVASDAYVVSSIFSLLIIVGLGSSLYWLKFLISMELLITRTWTISSIADANECCDLYNIKTQRHQCHCNYCCWLDISDIDAYRVAKASAVESLKSTWGVVRASRE